MIYLYNALQILGAPLLLLLMVCGFCSEKYRSRLGGRLGFGLGGQVPEKKSGVPRIWVHALSVGEVRSAAVLLHALSRHLPEVELVMSATTGTGITAAGEQKKMVRCLLPFPFDFWFSVRRFLREVKPDLFVLVETDFWPNLLWQLHRKKIPAVLVNGRISEKSWLGYRTGAFFFRPVFSMFVRLFMQTADDANRMREFGVVDDRVCAAGNLKYDAALLASSFLRQAENKQEGAAGSFLIVAGSTHAGEEEMLLAAFDRLRRQWPDCRLVLAPRDIGRAKAIGELVRRAGFSVGYCSHPDNAATEVLVVDLFGRLMEYYRLAAVVFVGGSLVQAGGHNPLEAAVFGKPILFGPHMEDFAEIERDLLAAGAALTVADDHALQEKLTALRGDAAMRKAMAQRAAAAVHIRSGSADRIVREIRRLLQNKGYSFFQAGNSRT